MKINWTQLETDNEETVIMLVSYTISYFFREKIIERKAFKEKKGVDLWFWLDTNELVYGQSSSLNAIYSTKEKKYVL